MNDFARVGESSRQILTASDHSAFCAEVLRIGGSAAALMMLELLLKGTDRLPVNVSLRWA